jgi:tetratricopeptide (TPR) repeat protein
MQLARSTVMDFGYLYTWTLGQREGLDPAEQGQLLEDAVQSDPDDRASRLALAECLRKLGRLDRADAVLKTLSSAEPEVRTISAYAALDRGDTASAEALLTVRLNEHDHPTLAQLRGQLALLRDDASEAVKQFQATLRAAPNSREAQCGLGQALRLLGQPQAAIPYLKAARDRDRLEWLVRSARPPARRKDPRILQEIGTACLAIGRHDQARAWYLLALSLDPSNSELQSLITQMSNEP